MKRKILKILSSCFGVLAVCGAFCCSIIFGSNKKSTRTNAIYNLVGMASYDFNYRFTASSMTDYFLYVDGTFNAYQLYGENGYHYEYVFSTRFKLYKISTDTYYPIYKYSSDLGTGIAYTFVKTISSIYSQEYHDYIPMYNCDEFIDVSVSTFTTSGIDLFTGLQTLNIGLPLYGNVNDLSVGLGVANVYCDLLLPEFVYVIIDPPVDLGTINLNIEVEDPYNIGYEEGYQAGNQVGYSNGVNDGYSSGYDVGHDDGYNSALPQIETAYSTGYTEGYNEGYSADSTVSTIFSNILLVGILPVDIFLRMLNWEFLGINIASFVSALISVAATVIVIRLVTGKKNG